MTTPLKKPVRMTIGQTADADDVHLDEDVVEVMRTAKKIAERAPGENVEILEAGHRRLQEIEQTNLRIPRCYHAQPRA